MSIPTINFYMILGISRTASKKEISVRINKILRETHPDLFPNDPEKAEKAKIANHAREWLENDQKRAEYDRELDRLSGRSSSSPKQQKNGYSSKSTRTPPNAARSAGQRHTYREHGDDVFVAVNLSFQEAFNGCTKLLNGYNIDISGGVRDKVRLVVDGAGGDSPDGGRPGNLFIDVTVQPHPIFSYFKDTDELSLVVFISELESIFGTRVSFLDLDGTMSTLRIPPRTNDNKSWRADSNQFVTNGSAFQDGLWVTARVVRIDGKKLSNMSEAAKYGLGLLNFELHGNGVRDKTLFPD